MLQYNFSIADLSKDRVSLLIDTTLYLLSQESYNNLIKRLENIHKILIQNHDDNFIQNRSIYSVVFGLIRDYLIIGKYRNIEEIARQSLETAEAVFDDNDSRTLNLLYKLKRSRCQ